jgi:hypothetical protein
MVFEDYFDYKDRLRSEFVIPHLQNCLNSASKIWDRNSFHDAIYALEELSLVQSYTRNSNGSISLRIHPVVQDWLRLRTSLSDGQHLSNMAALILHSTMDIELRLSRVETRIYSPDLFSIHSRNCKQFFTSGSIDNKFPKHLISLTIGFADLCLHKYLIFEALCMYGGVTPALRRDDLATSILILLKEGEDYAVGEQQLQGARKLGR